MAFEIVVTFKRNPRISCYRERTPGMILVYSTTLGKISVVFFMRTLISREKESGTDMQTGGGDRKEEEGGIGKETEVGWKEFCIVTNNGNMVSLKYYTLSHSSPIPSTELSIPS